MDYETQSLADKLLEAARTITSPFVLRIRRLPVSELVAGPQLQELMKKPWQEKGGGGKGKGKTDREEGGYSSSSTVP
eukprot:4897320-Prorocentrum_lima.AAC.1